MGFWRSTGRAFQAVVDWPLRLGELLVAGAARSGRARVVLLPLAVLAALALFAFFLDWALSANVS